MRVSPHFRTTATAFIGAATVLTAIGTTTAATATATATAGTATGAATVGSDRALAAAIAGGGSFTYDEPDVYGHRIRFNIHARTTVDGSTRGSFSFWHLLPDGKLAAKGRADVTCLQVSGGTALLTAVVPEGQGNVRNHAFYVKIIDGGSGRPDQIANAQAQNGSERPPQRCVDFEVEHPGPKRYPIERGNYVIRG
jgi:hypothetical protein